MVIIEEYGIDESSSNSLQSILYFSRTKSLKEALICRFSPQLLERVEKDNC